MSKEHYITFLTANNISVKKAKWGKGIWKCNNSILSNEFLNKKMQMLQKCNVGVQIYYLCDLYIFSML